MKFKSLGRMANGLMSTQIRCSGKPGSMPTTRSFLHGIGLADLANTTVLEVGVMSGGVMADRLFTKILVPVDFSPCSKKRFRLALSFAKSYQAEVLLLHVVDTKSLNALNRLGLAPATEAAKQKKQLHHFARLNARQLLARDDAKGVTIRRLLADGCPFEEIARTARVEGSIWWSWELRGRDRRGR